MMKAAKQEDTQQQEPYHQIQATVFQEHHEYLDHDK